MNSMRTSASTSAATHYASNILYGTLMLMFFMSVILLVGLGENLMFFIPLFFAIVGLILNRLTTLRVWLLLSIVCTLLHAFSFLHALAMALTIGAYGAIMMFAFFDIMMLIPLADLYMMRSKK